MSPDRAEVLGGVDTHKHTHVAVALDAAGTLLGTAVFAADAAGCGDLLGWLRTHGTITRVGVEGTGSCGAGLARRFAAEGIDVVEVNRPNRHTRRRRGKTDTVDAESAARAVLSGEATALPKSGDGCAEAIRVLSVTRRSAVKARTVAANQVSAILLTAPQDLKDRFGTLSAGAAAEACTRLRPDRSCDTVTAAVKTALRTLARRHQALTDEIAQLDVELRTLCEQANPALLGAVAVGVETASALLVAAGDNPQRMRSEASFAALRGASPVEASSGPQIRHRLNRGGNRNANNALRRIAFTRMRVDQRTIDYAKRRQAEGKTRRETIRCLKRHIAREVYRLLTDPPSIPNRHDLRQQRTRAGLTIEATARALNTWPTRISELENGHRHDRDLAERYQQHLTQLTT